MVFHFRRQHIFDRGRLGFHQHRVCISNSDSAPRLLISKSYFCSRDYKNNSCWLFKHFALTIISIGGYCLLVHLVGLEPTPQLSISLALIWLLKVVTDIHNLVFQHDTDTYKIKQFVISAISSTCNSGRLYPTFTAEQSILGVSPSLSRFRVTFDFLDSFPVSLHS